MIVYRNETSKPQVQEEKDHLTLTYLIDAKDQAEEAIAAFAEVAKEDDGCMKALRADKELWTSMDKVARSATKKMLQQGITAGGRWQRCCRNGRQVARPRKILDGMNFPTTVRKMHSITMRLQKGGVFLGEGSLSRPTRDKVVREIRQKEKKKKERS